MNAYAWYPGHMKYTKLYGKQNKFVTALQALEFNISHFKRLKQAASYSTENKLYIDTIKYLINKDLFIYMKL
jgi:hypothetical protein